MTIEVNYKDGTRWVGDGFPETMSSDTLRDVMVVLEYSIARKMIEREKQNEHHNS